MKKRLVCVLLALALMLPLMPSAFALTDLNIYAESSFDKEYAVYSGPGVYYYRANNGRASYGWGGVRVYGVEGDWVMIGYGLSNGAYRIGYISKDCLDHTKYVTGSINYNLTFDGVTAYPNNNCYITDDPVMYNDFLCQIPAGQAVTALGVMGDWTYIETNTAYGKMRGFVYSFTLSYSGGTPTVEPYHPTTAVPTTLPPYTPPTATPYTPPTAVPYVPTAAPTLTISVVNQYGANIVQWTGIPNAVSYTVRKHTYNTSYSSIATVGGTSYSDNAVTGGVLYYYQVTARLQNGAEIVSNEVTAYMNNPVTAAPTARPTATLAPYVPPTATPVASIPNTFYHDTSKGTWLPSYQRVQFSSSWAVYSGPGEYYYRAANGRALMGGGSCIVFGVENGWVMIGYGLSNGNFRIGYISQAALPQLGLRIPYLDLAYTTRQLTYAANLTDDIIRYQPTVATLPAGTYVLFLGYVYESNTTWAYVEVLADNSIMRGFIPASAL